MTSDNGKPDIVPIDTKKAELDEASHAIAESLQKALPADCLFALFIYRPDGSMKYISSGEIADVDAVVTRWRAKVFARPQPVGENPMPDAKGPKPGEKKWSNHFGQNVVLVAFVDDAHWTFRLAVNPEKGVARAKTPWSQMPPARSDSRDAI